MIQFTKQFLIILSVLLPGYLLADGSISGKILDAKTGEVLPGAIAMIEGTTIGVTADFDGNFKISNLKAGTYVLVAKYVSYNSKTISNVVVDNNKSISVDITLHSAEQNLKEVEITAEANRETMTALLIQQKNNVSVSDGVSAEVIKRTPDRSSSDVLKRISGATIQENKFAIIRGMNDRYNAAYLNGLPLPSSESDRKAFAFDIFPSAVLENMVITKTANPELLGDFGGGLISINTKETPDSKQFNIALSAGANSTTLHQAFKSYQGGKTDFIGIDDGTRNLPKNLPSASDYKAINSSDPLKANYSQQFNGNLSLNQQASAPNFGLQTSFGNTIKVLNKDFGMVLALTYNNSSRYSECFREGYGNNNEKLYEFTDKAYINNTLAGIMANFTLKLDARNKISFKNLYSINADNSTTLRSGKAGLSDEPYQNTSSYNFYYNSNRLFTNQLEGSHIIGSNLKSKYRATWNIGLSNVNRTVPDYRTISYGQASDNTDAAYNTGIAGSGPNPRNNGRFFSSLGEQLYTAKYDIGRQSDFSEKFKNIVKIGAFHQYRTRNFDGRKFGYINNAKGNTKDSLNTLAIGQIFQSQNIGSNKFILEEITNANDAYTAHSVLNAAFLMFDTRMGEKLRFVYGLRAENYTQKINSGLVNINTSQLDLLPSLNFTYSLSEKTNLRFAATKTLNRPEFRELAPFGFFDFSTQSVYIGNDALQRSTIHNYDVRYEYYPSANELVSVSLFHKNIYNPIELGFSAVSGGDSRTFTYYNAQAASNQGIEFEFRKNFDFLGALIGSNFCKNVVLFANAALIKSEVNYKVGTTSTTGKKRALQGQSPYIINGGVQYDCKENGWAFGALINRVGARIVYAGNINTPDIYENPRTVIDFQVGKTYKKFDFRLTVGDVLHQNLTYYEDRNKNQKLDGEDGSSNPQLRDNVIFNYKNGTSATLRIAYRF